MNWFLLHTAPPSGLVIGTKEVTTFAGNATRRGHMDGVGTAAQFGTPEHIAYDGAGNLYVSDYTAQSTVRKIEVATAKVTTVAGVYGMADVFLSPLPGGLNQPRGMAWLPNRGLAVVDYEENAVLNLPLR